MREDNMKNKLTAALIIGLLFSALAAEGFGQTRKSGKHSGRQKKSSPQKSTQTNFAGDYKSLIKKLRDKGSTVKEGGKISQPFFSVPGRAVIVNGEQAQVFEYRKKETADKESGSVNADGSLVGTTMITWVAPPHFYKNGRLIVLYIGENSGIIKALENALGRQFAGK